MRSLLIVIGVFWASLGFTKSIPLELFAKDSEFKSVRLSPDGKHLAATMPHSDRTVLVVLNRETMQPVYGFRFGENEHISRFFWANNERLVFTRVEERGDSEIPVSYGQIYAGNLDGTKSYPVFGYQAGGSSSVSRMNKNKATERASGTIAHMLPDDPEHILVLAKSWGSGPDESMRLLKVNIYQAKKELITRTPFGNMQLTFNSDGLPVTATGVDFRGNRKMFFYKDLEWKEVSEKEPIHALTPIYLNKQGDKLYLQAPVDEKTTGIYEYDLASKELKLVFNDPKSDVVDLIVDSDDNSMVGAVTMPGKVEYHYFGEGSDFAKLHQSLTSAFGGVGVSILSSTDDMNEHVLFVQSDKNPGDFYLFNRKKGSADYLLSTKKWIDPAIMSERRPISFKARDGETIHGYLTLPKDSKKPVPLVTYVHGGPYGIRDEWWFDSQSQLLANNGFAVLQVNYRGSGGYGETYEKTAYKKRSTLIQHDIIDGTKWAMSRPDVEAKACIMGWSFGGYSALMSPLIEPELFSCSIAAAGVYDAVRQEKSADYAAVHSLSFEVDEKYGKDEDLLKKESPVTYIDKLKAPIMIVHGGNDTRVPPEQAYILKEALEERNKSYEWFFKEKEGHGFFDPKNRVEFYQRSLEFLNKHLR